MRNSKAENRTAVLPSYIIERNTRAIGGGLWIEKQSISKSKLSTVYRGLPASFIKAGFVKDRSAFEHEVAGTNKHLASSLYMNPIFSPIHHTREGLYRTDGQELRMTITRELLPRRQWTPGPDVSAFEVLTLDGVANVYTASSVEKFRAAEVLPDNFDAVWDHRFKGFNWCEDYRGDRRDAGSQYVAWRLAPDPYFGFFRLERFPVGEGRAAKEDRHMAKYPLKDVAEYREHLMCAYEEALEYLSEISTVVTRNGKAYALDAASAARIENLLEEAERIVASAQIHTSRDPDLIREAEARMKRQSEYHAKLKAAGSDIALQQFLAKVIPFDPSRKGGQ